MEKRWIPIVAVVFVALIFIGEALTYTSGIYSYDSSAERNGSVVDYSVSSSGTNDYSAVLIDNDGFKRLDKLAIYVDEDYDKHIDKLKYEVPICNMNPVYYAEQIQRALKNRSFENVIICDRQELIDYLEETKDSPEGCGIMSPSYALPGEIYKGNASDPLMKWIEAGGSLYWVGSIPGAVYYENGEPVIFLGSQMLLFGADDCINTDWALDPNDYDKEFTKVLGLTGYELAYGVNTAKLPDGKQFRMMGCIRDGVAANVLVKYGEGMVVQSAGPFRIEQVDDITQVMVSGMCYKSTIIDYEQGRVTRGTIRGSFNSAEGDVLYLFIGKAYPVYGRAYDV